MFKKLFEKDQALHNTIIQLTLPVIAEQAFITLMGIVNTMMAAHISKEAAAAISLIDALNNTFITAFSSLAVGATVVVAHYTGQNDRNGSSEASKQAIYAGFFLATFVALFIGITRNQIVQTLFKAAEPTVLSLALKYLNITLFTYPLIALTSIACGVLRGSGDTRTPAKVIILMNAVNVFFSYLFIFGFKPLGLPSFGIPGAAYGIATARISGAIILIYVLIKGSSYLQIPDFFQYRLKLDYLKSVFKIGIPASIESLLFNSGKLITQTFIVASGTVAIVADSIAMSIHSFVVIPGSALGITTTTLVGQYMGRSNPDKAREAILYLRKLASICLVTINLAIAPFFPWIASLYNPNPEIVHLATILLYISTSVVVLWSFSYLVPSGLRGAGDVRYTLTTAVVSMWLCRITLGYLLCIKLNWGVIGMWIAMYIDWIIRSIMFNARLKGEKWLKHVVVKKIS